MIFFTADTHFGHQNILQYCNRPFSSIEEHDEELIKRWNSKVSMNDEVYHLGDISYDTGDWSVLNRLNFKHLYLIVGNHDHDVLKNICKLERPYSISTYGEHNEYVSTLVRINFQGIPKDVVLSHFPMASWERSHYGSYHLFGHVHGQTEDDQTVRSLDVGVDCWDYYPVSAQEIEERMMKKTFVPLTRSNLNRGSGVGLGREEYMRVKRYNKFLALKKEFEP